MSYPQTFELKNVDPDDIDEVLLKVERSFGFFFRAKELEHIKTFGELCDIIANNVQCGNLNDCTTQQAFYKLRQAIADTMPIDKNSIKPGTNLQDVFVKTGRREKVAAINKALGLKLKVLQPKHWIVDLLGISIFISLIGLFLFWKIALAVLVTAIFLLNITNRFGNQMAMQTVGEIAQKMAREHYAKARRNPAIINKNEIVKTVKKLFSEELILDEAVLTRGATFN